MKPIEGEKSTMRSVSRDEEGKKRIENSTRNPDTLKYVEKKLADKGLHRLDRHPVNGYGGIGRGPPKSGHGGKYTWEGPTDNVLDESPLAVDENDPNYVDDDVEEEVRDLVVGEVPVAKTAPEGVARVDVDPRLLHNNV